VRVVSATSCGSAGGGDRLLVTDFEALADEALLVLLAHVRVYLVRAEEALSAELAQRVYATLDLLGRDRGAPAAAPARERRQMHRERRSGVQRVLVREDLFMPDAQVTRSNRCEYKLPFMMRQRRRHTTSAGRAWHGHAA
jgi:hypothetical protein